MELKRKEFTYRGKTMDELKALDVREFAKYLKARQRRTVLRQFQDIEKFVSRAKEKISKEKKLKTHKRDLVIVPGMVGMKIQIYDGHGFIPIEIIGEMLGHRFGEFALTRKKVNHGTAGIGATKGSKAKAK
ncbi:30S ribosomal protein S19 [Candidatus Pacearchaeota archaeon RBG_16_35_8]|uniref:Small ribosomal subunit protein uS19 n=1 Tax=uncultured archaeon Rifle_16ft_4_minimus_1461 TaxID=1665151 RepID=A0A0H4T330_9ARCH|nr:30S ribosomal protein S19 [uncultured archaeon]AJS13196.1 30S ribosomal protein S19, small subunit ribosomal protein S19 [uncultured archaeon]AKQ01100.1 30S ribosomal protein S19, small subunit ribosomal protein S19 [uncultured archaeon Rifle_16ft_4_minimus_1461]OGJ12332.1 MAG: 30S ribosomal protein S19 [Candidatus Pacearchaeota archaeon RBG_16_35_8]